jgi:hypothetical protein
VNADVGGVLLAVDPAAMHRRLDALLCALLLAGAPLNSESIAAVGATPCSPRSVKIQAM